MSTQVAIVHVRVSPVAKRLAELAAEQAETSFSAFVRDALRQAAVRELAGDEE